MTAALIDYEPQNLKRWEMPDDYFGAVWPAYYSSGVGQSRDSDALERSNFTAMLEALGGETETVQIVRASHWAVGWVEWIAIHQDDGAALQIADEQVARLKDYPVLDEEAFSALEWQEATDYWDGMSPREKVQYAMEERRRYHWPQAEPVWIYGRMNYSELANYGGKISEAVCESLRNY